MAEQENQDLDTMSTEDLQKYVQERRDVLKGTETLRDTVKRAYFREKDVPPQVPLTAESAKHLVAVSEAILVDASIRKVQGEAENFKTEQEARNQRIKDGHPLPGDVPWEVPRRTLPSGPRQEVSTRRHPTRPMYTVNLPCATCGKNVPELSFQPTPGRPIYCQDCYMKVLDQRRGGDRQKTIVVVDKDKAALQEENKQLLEENERLRAQTVGRGGKDTGGKGKLSKKDRRQLKERFSDDQ